MKSVGVCARCGETTLIHGRRLDRRCYYRARMEGTLADYPPVTRSNDELMEDYRLLRGQGYSHRQVAERLGIKLPTLRRALCRARAREAGVMREELIRADVHRETARETKPHETAPAEANDEEGPSGSD